MCTVAASALLWYGYCYDRCIVVVRGIESSRICSCWEVAMIAKIRSGAVRGIDGFGVTVEIDITRGLPAFTIVGLPNAAVRESRERVISSIRNNGFKFPRKRVTVNLAPADIRKEGASFDLPIAIGILLCSGQIRSQNTEETIILGELALDGKLKPVKGILPITCFARDSGLGCVVVPEKNSSEASAVSGIGVAACVDLGESIDVLEGRSKPRPPIEPAGKVDPGFELDYSQVAGQRSAKRALQVAASGGHNVLMIGPPGSGKTMLARRLVSILPPLDEDEALECAKIKSVIGGLDGTGISYRRPYRAPHHSASDAGLVGGGRNATPGEVTLAHNGVLFLDELSEFRRNVLETLRQPIEEGRIVISRASASCCYPARVQLVAALNPCPCGYSGSKVNVCTCTPLQIRRYLTKISGPLLDRISIHIPVRALSKSDLEDGFKIPGPASGEMREAVMRAAGVQADRYRGFESIRRNSDVPYSLLEDLCPMEAGAAGLLSKAQFSLHFSARSRKNIIQVARTIADLSCSELIGSEHMAEAIQYRMPKTLCL